MRLQYTGPHENPPRGLEEALPSQLWHAGAILELADGVGALLHDRYPGALRICNAGGPPAIEWAPARHRKDLP